MKKRILAVILGLSMFVGMLSGCGNSSDGEKQEVVDANEATDENKESTGEPLEMMTYHSGSELDRLKGIVESFTEETGIEIDLVTPGMDYEGIMKTRMASGDLPDIFVTHGYSTTRYKEYVTPLNDEAWADSVSEGLRSVITDEDGNLCCFPGTQTVLAITYNKTVLENAGVKAEEIITMDDFKTACEKIKASGVTPIFACGKESDCFGMYYDTMAVSYYVPEDSICPSAEKLQNGTFNWDEDGAYLFNDIADFVNSGFVNVDMLTADRASMEQALASGNCAFVVDSIGVLNYALEYNPDAELGILPVPATTATGPACYSTGEGSQCWAIWKDSDKMEQAKEFFNYLAKPEVLVTVMSTNGEPAGLVLEGVEIDSASYEAFTESEKLFAGKTASYNIFDREYITVDVWANMIDASMEVFSNPTEAGIKSAVTLLKDDYVAKMELVQ